MFSAFNSTCAFLTAGYREIQLRVFIMEGRAAKKQKTTSNSEGPRITDPRFQNIQSDPRYRLPGKSYKVKLDKRFARVLKDEDFVKRAKVDRYGRPVESGAEKRRLKRKFELDEDNEEHSDVPDDDDEVQRELREVEKKTRDPLREGRETDLEASLEDESTSDEESEADEAEVLDDEPSVGLNTQQDIPTGEATSRIAIVNLDWDNIHATDLMAVFSSFLPSTGGSLLKVAIYPSEFGKERLEREEMEGPPKGIFANAAREDDDDDVSADEEENDEEIQKSLLKEGGDKDFNPTALRAYQLDRLRYFYAILTFSSPTVAQHIYELVDGTEYLRTANFFDLRFVPDETDFSTDTPREECEDIPGDYRPMEFVTDALQHSKVRLTWDEEDVGRKEAVARAFKAPKGKAKGAKARRAEEDENDLMAYLASDNSEDDEEDDEVEIAGEQAEVTPALSKKEAERQRMRALLGLAPEPTKNKSSKGKDKAPVGGMQITFASGLSGDSKDDKNKKSVFENSPEPDETTVEKYVRKEKERKQKRKEKMKSQPAADEEAETKDRAARDTADQIIQEKDEEEADALGFDDPFFAEPSASTEKVTSKKIRKEERLKKRQEREAAEEADRKQRAELELLMVDDATQDDDAGGGKKSGKMRHFDMREIQKAEKEERKKGKKKHGKDKSKSKSKDAEREGDRSAVADDFTLNTTDPRFSRLFESHEYAIDPTNPRFKGTKGMKALLDEGRKRKDRPDRTGNVNKDRKEKDTVKDRGIPDIGASASAGDVQTLVEKIKRRQKS